MTIFYVLINSDIASDKLEKQIAHVLGKDAKYEFINCYGVYDAVIKVTDKNESPRDLNDKIRNVNKVQSTMVLTVVS